MKFIIQTINGEVKHDFSFTLIESCNYNNWIRNNNDFTYELTDEETKPGFIPVGSVEFVSKYLNDHHGIIPKPINIPSALLDSEFTGRYVFNGQESDLREGMKMFVKSNETIKSFTEITDVAPIGSYQISELINIESEWRGFVYNGELVGLQNYSGSFDVFPDVLKMKEMIKFYYNQPIAYTLDVAIDENYNTVIIEVHDFFSCGLYGFSDHKILPFMLSKWFYSTIKNK